MRDIMKKAIITGASRRLGLHITKALLKRGWQVHAVTRIGSSALRELNSEHLIVHEIQSYDKAATLKFIADFRRFSSDLDLLVNNASVYEKDSAISARGPDFYEELFFIHMMFPGLLINGLAKHLSNANGNIVSITDIYADNPNPDYSFYCSTKAGLQNLTIGAAKKYAPTIRANCIQPGPIKFLDDHSEEHKAEVLSETLLNFEGGFDPIVETLEFILDNNYLTGQSIKVDGGRSLVRG
jgi:dihydromonapterin reductase/dihydrofolate reductase